jgi:hypothetical protein
MSNPSEGLSGSEEEDGSISNLSDLDDDLESFPQFSRFPMEIRALIWEAFCPDLTTKGRVYQFGAAKPPYRPDVNPVLQGEDLEEQTRSARAVLAAHRESRQLALKSFPDTLLFGKHAVLRFNAKWDVIYIITQFGEVFGTKLPASFCERIQHFAFSPSITSFNHLSPAFWEPFGNLKVVYYQSRATHILEPRTVRWCVSGLARQYESCSNHFCWPDLESHPNLKVEDIPPASEKAVVFHEKYCGVKMDSLLPPGSRFKLWPMV